MALRIAGRGELGEERLFLRKQGESDFLRLSMARLRAARGGDSGQEQAAHRQREAQIFCSFIWSNMSWWEKRRMAFQALLIRSCF